MPGINEYTALMLHMDGADDSTVFTDSSGNGHSVTAYGGAKIDASQGRFGQSAEFDGSGDFLKVGNSAVLNCGSSDLTVDFWMRVRSAPEGEWVTLCAWEGTTWSARGFVVQLYLEAIVSGTYYFKIYATFKGATSVYLATSYITDLAFDTWYHVAVVRSGSTWKIYYQGQSLATQTGSITINYTTAYTLKIAGGSFDYEFDGQIDEFRIQNGEAYWTTDFTPPTTPYAGVSTPEGEMDETAGMSAVVDAYNPVETCAETAGMSALFDGLFEYEEQISQTAGLNAVLDAINLRLLLSQYGDSPKRYFCRLTGNENGLDDLALPVGTIQARLRQGDPNYLAVTVPGMSLAAGITARAGGQLIVDMAIIHGGAEVIREEIARVNLESIRMDEGGQSKTITLSGHRTTTYPVKISSLRGVTYRALSGDGKLTFRCAEPDLYLRPGDTIRYGADEVIAGMVQFNISPKSQSMTVTEAD